MEYFPICAIPLGLYAIFLFCSIIYEQAGTKVGPDQLGPPVRVGSTRINSDRLGSSQIMQKT